MQITAVLCLNEAVEIPVPAEIVNQFVWERVAIPDGYTGGIPELDHFARALATLSQWRDQGHTIYVHCLAGIGRSPSVCAAYLVARHGLSLEAALKVVRDRHPSAQPDQHQVRVMEQFFAVRSSEQSA